MVLDGLRSRTHPTTALTKRRHLGEIHAALHLPLHAPRPRGRLLQPPAALPLEDHQLSRLSRAVRFCAVRWPLVSELIEALGRQELAARGDAEVEDGRDRRQACGQRGAVQSGMSEMISIDFHGENSCDSKQEP